MRALLSALLLLAALAVVPSATATGECPANAHHPENDPDACVCDAGHHWSAGRCVSDEPTQNPCRPTCVEILVPRVPDHI